MNRKIVLLVCALLSSGVMSLLELRIAYASPYINIDVDTAYNMIVNGSYPDLLVLDVRTQSEFESGYIYGALWIPVGELEARINELANHKDHEMIVYCLAGGRSATASGILDSNNFTKVYNMLGGISAWESAGYPVWIPIIGDINDDGAVNILDGVIIGAAFGSRPGDLNWNPIADIVPDNYINIQDIVLWGTHFGETA